MARCGDLDIDEAGIGLGIGAMGGVARRLESQRHKANSAAVNLPSARVRVAPLQPRIRTEGAR